MVKGNRQQKQQLNASYNILNKIVKKSAREDKRRCYEAMARPRNTLPNNQVPIRKEINTKQASEEWQWEVNHLRGGAKQTLG